MNIGADRKVFYEKLARQLAEDYSVSFEDITGKENVFVKKELREKRRRFNKDDYFIKVLSINGKNVFCVSEPALEEVKETFKDVNGAWFSQYDNIYKLNEIIKKYGSYIADGHQFYLPGNPNFLDEETLNSMKEKYDVKMYEGDEIEQFRGDKRFSNALSFSETAPDMIAFTASLNGSIIGMSGVSRDSEDLWQIGIDVFPESRGLNIGPMLTILLKNEVIRRGKVPFYGTADSHIQSQKVAVKSGFLPGWWECYSKFIEKK